MTAFKEDNDELVIVIPSDGELHRNTMDFLQEISPTKLKISVRM